MKKIFSSITLLCAVLTLSAQNKTFIVTSNNGSSQYVPNLFFQKNAEGNRFSWSGESSDYQDAFDIRNLMFIARANEQMKTATAEEVTQMLEEVSGTDQASANAVASVLKENPNVEEASSNDGCNVVVKMKGENGFTMYPCYDIKSVFSDDVLLSNEAKARNIQRKATNRAAKVPGRRAAIFNFFGYNNYNEYGEQSHIIQELQLQLEEFHGYAEAALYGYGDFTVSKLNQVVENSANYHAIIIMTYGGIGSDGQSYIATLEPSTDKNDIRMQDPDSPGTYYKMVSVKDLEDKINANCILYLGASCSIAPNRSSAKPNVIGWKNKTSMAQAHAYLLFTTMAKYNMNLKDALAILPKNDPNYSDAYLYAPNPGNLQFPGNPDNNYLNNIDVDLTTNSKFYKSGSIPVDGEVISSEYGAMPDHVTVRLVPLLWSGHQKESLSHTVELYGTGAMKNKFSTAFNTDNNRLKEDIYQVMVVESFGEVEVNSYPSTPTYVVLSSKFRDTYAMPNLSLAETQAPQVKENDQKVTNIEVSTNNVKTYSIDGYAGHRFKVTNPRQDIVNASVVGKTLSVTGVQHGTTVVYVDDDDNYQSEVLTVSVTEAAYPDLTLINNGGEVTLPIDMETFVLITSGSGSYQLDENSYDSNVVKAEIGTTDYGEQCVKLYGNKVGYEVIKVKDVLSGQTVNLPVRTVSEINIALERSEATIKVGESIDVKITAGYGEYSVSNSYPNIATAQIIQVHPPYQADEYYVRVTGVSAGSVAIGVYDERGQTETGLSVGVIEDAPSTPYVSCPDNNHPHMIDMGLSVKWACCNVGASKPEEYGGYYAWGETTPKNTYNWSTYKYCNGSSNTLTKYCWKSSYGNEGFTDELVELLPEDDAATANWGNDWQMPSIEQYEELINSSNTTCKRIIINDVKGMLITSDINGNTIFLPNGGRVNETGFEDKGSTGLYWSRSVNTYYWNTAHNVSLTYTWGGTIASSRSDSGTFYFRYVGASVRPVRTGN